MALVELKKIGAYIIGTDIGTSLNCFGNCPSNLDIDKLNLIVISSSTYWYYDKELSLTGYEKDEFNTYFNNKKELLEPVLLHPDKYVYLTKEDIINEYDEQKKEAINYFKKIKEVNRIVGKNKKINMNYVYHGSSIPNLEVIKKHKSTHMKEWVYACHSKGIATIFLSKQGSDLFYSLFGYGKKIIQ